MLEVVLTMFVVLFAFLAGGLWIGWTLAVTGTVPLAGEMEKATLLIHTAKPPRPKPPRPE